jgi:hypothetical protein
MHAYIHCLPHKYFEVSYSDGLIPLYKVSGTFHDGTNEGEELMQARFEKKRKRMDAKQD